MVRPFWECTFRQQRAIVSPLSDLEAICLLDNQAVQLQINLPQKLNSGATLQYSVLRELDN